MDELMNYNCIDFKKLLILKAKGLKIGDQECYILMIIMTLNEIGMKPITPSRIHEFCSLSLSKIDESLLSLLDKNIIARNKGLLDLKPLYSLLVNENKKEEKKIDLISIFEDAFGRSLNQIELGIIQQFMTKGCDDQMILDALNEAVKSSALSFRYIEAILDNWLKYGVKKRYAPSQVSQESVDQKIKDYKWWENNE